MKKKTIGVVIQGGAMRSVYCIGVLRCLLEDKRLEGNVHFFTSSAGCISPILAMAANFNVEKYKELTSKLFGMVGNRKFINKMRLFRVVDVEFLALALVEILSSNAKLDEIDAILTVTITSSVGETQYLDFNSKSIDFELLRDAIMASMSIPVLYPKKSMIDNERYYDGGMFDPLPLCRAIQEDDVDHYYVIASKSMQTLIKEKTRNSNSHLSHWIGFSRDLRKALKKPSELYVNALDMIEKGSDLRPIIVIIPSDDEKLGSRTDINHKRLLKLEQKGFDDAKIVLDKKKAL